MKANRKFVDGEEAVSAVIGVILMVAITVAIAATVYVYVSGMMGGEEEVTPVITFTQKDTAVVNSLTVVSADPGDLTWGDIDGKITPTGGISVDMTDVLTSGTIVAGDIISITQSTGAYTVTLRHIPSNTLIGSWDFTSA